MFNGTADVYDAFYDALGKDYEWEARKVLRLVRRHRPRPRTLLDVACGTGRHLEVFARSLRCVGVDLDGDMVRVAAARCPGARVAQADMTTLDLGERFDVVTCLFSSIAYVPSVRVLRSTVRRLVAHLEPGGVLAVEPWFQPDEWEDGYLAMLTVDQPDLKAARSQPGVAPGSASIIDFEYVIADAGGLRRVSERHELRLFRWDQYLDAVAAAGLRVETDDYGLFGRGLVLGVKEAGEDA